MAEDDMMDSLPPLRMATPGEYEALAAALVRYGRHRYNCTGFMGGPLNLPPEKEEALLKLLGIPTTKEAHS